MGNTMATIEQILFPSELIGRKISASLKSEPCIHEFTDCLLEDVNTSLDGETWLQIKVVAPHKAKATRFCIRLSDIDSITFV